MDPNLEKSSSNATHIKRVLIGKLTYAVGSCVLAQILLLLLYIFLVNLKPFAPLESLTTFAQIITKFSTWLYVAPLMTIIFLHIISYGKNYVTHPTYSPTRLKRLLAMFSTNKAIHLLLHVTVGLSAVLMFILLGADDFMVKRCHDKYCLIGNDFNLSAFGSYLGLYYFLNIYRSEKNILFPTASQKKWLQFKANLIGILLRSRRSAFWPTLHFLCYHLIFGNFAAQSFASHFNVGTIGGGGIYLYATAYVFCTLIYSYLNLVCFFYELYLTEPVRFPLIPICDDAMALNEAIASKVRVIQHLGGLDLLRLSGSDKARRDVLFALSQPGGHPHNWNNLIQSVLKIIRDYSDSLNKSTNSLLTQDAPKTVNGPVVVAATPPLKLPINYDKIRNMTLQCEYYSPNNKIPVAVDDRKNFLVERIDGLIENFKEKSGINYIFRELPEVNLQRSLGDGQVIIWLVQSLSGLTVASLKEDRYGIVQKDLPVIISTVVELKTSLEKLNRLPVLNRKGVDDFNCKMKMAMCGSVRRSLYNICNSFGPYLKDLNLKREISVQLQPFLNFRPEFV